MTFVPPDFVSQIEAMSPKDCPYCQAFPAIPCVLHRPQREIVVKGTSVGLTTFLLPEVERG